MKFYLLGVDESNLDDPRLKKDNVIGVPKIYIPTWNDTRPYQIWKGSRFSAKSWTKGIQWLLKAHTDKYFRGVFARHTQKAARESQFKLFEDIITIHYPALRQFFTINKQEMSLTHKNNNNMIKGGSFEQPESLMSVPDITDFWAEEPITRTKKIERSPFNDIAGTLRNPFGVLPIFHMTFNPIDEINFIYEDFYSTEKVYHEDTVCSVTANWYDNPFCPQDRIEYLNKMKLRDPSRYMVDGEGQWGVIQTGQEWATNFDRGYHVKPLKYNKDLHCHLTLDQNYQPYATGIVSQMETIGDILHIYFIDEICLKPPTNSTEQLCYEYSARGYRTPYFYGDASGKNQGQRKSLEDARDHYEVVERHFKNPSMNRVIRRNPPRAPRRRTWNRMLAGEYDVQIHIDPNCKNFIADLEKLQTDRDGCYLKPKVKDKTSGVTYEMYGHCTDAVTYQFYYLFEDWFREG